MGIRHFLGLRRVFTRVPSYPTTHVVAVTYLVCVYLLYRGPTTRTHRIVIFWSALFDYLGTRSPRCGYPVTMTYTKFLFCVNILCECPTTGRTRNGKLLVGPVAPNYEYYR